MIVSPAVEKKKHAKTARFVRRAVARMLKFICANIVVLTSSSIIPSPTCIFLLPPRTKVQSTPTSQWDRQTGSQSSYGRSRGRRALRARSPCYRLAGVDPPRRTARLPRARGVGDHRVLRRRVVKDPAEGRRTAFRGLRPRQTCRIDQGRRTRASNRGADATARQRERASQTLSRRSRWKTGKRGPDPTDRRETLRFMVSAPELSPKVLLGTPRRERRRQLVRVRFRPYTSEKERRRTAVIEIGYRWGGECPMRRRRGSD